LDAVDALLLVDADTILTGDKRCGLLSSKALRVLREEGANENARLAVLNNRAAAGGGILIAEPNG